jgi:hypothetical protein
MAVCPWRDPVVRVGALSIAMVSACAGDPLESLSGGADDSGSTAPTSSSDEGTPTTTVATTVASGESGESSAADSGAPSSSGSSGSDASTGDTGSSDGGESQGESTGELSCSTNREPPGGDCPIQCNGGCDDNRCSIDCDGPMACASNVIVCPPDFECEVRCDGDNACHNSEIDCPDDYACAVGCDGPNACHGVAVIGATGTVRVACGGEADVCHDLALSCGSVDSSLSCETPQDLPEPLPPSIASPCACESQGC